MRDGGAQFSFPSQLLVVEVLRRPVESAQYLSIRYSERLREAGVDASCGTVGDSYDNAMAESVIGLFKAEVVHHAGPWRGQDDVEYATLEWVQWYNDRRLHSQIDYLSPKQYEEQFLLARNESVQSA